MAFRSGFAGAISLICFSCSCSSAAAFHSDGHPRLYFNDHCTPGTEWIRFTPLRVPTDRIWTAKDDARYISPLSRLPATATRSASRAPGTSSPSTAYSDRCLLCHRTVHNQAMATAGAASPVSSCRRGSIFVHYATSTFRRNRMAFTATMRFSSSPTLPRSSSWRRSPSSPAWRCRRR